MFCRKHLREGCWNIHFLPFFCWIFFFFHIAVKITNQSFSYLWKNSRWEQMSFNHSSLPGLVISSFCLGDLSWKLLKSFFKHYRSDIDTWLLPVSDLLIFNKGGVNKWVHQPRHTTMYASQAWSGWIISAAHRIIEWSQEYYWYTVFTPQAAVCLYYSVTPPWLHTANCCFNIEVDTIAFSILAKIQCRIEWF